MRAYPKDGVLLNNEENLTEQSREAKKEDIRKALKKQRNREAIFFGVAFLLSFALFSVLLDRIDLFGVMGTGLFGLLSFLLGGAMFLTLECDYYWEKLEREAFDDIDNNTTQNEN